MPMYTLPNGITKEVKFGDIELNDKPKEDESKVYLPLHHTDENGEEYFTYIQVSGQEKLDAIRAIMNITNLDMSDATVVASSYLRRLDSASYRDLYDRIKKEVKEVELDRRPIDIVNESIKRINNALFFAKTAREIEASIDGVDLREFLKHAVEFRNYRFRDMVLIDDEYPNLLDNMKKLISDNSPKTVIRDIELDKRYYLDKSGKVLTKKRER